MHTCVAVNLKDLHLELFVWAVVFGRTPMAMIFWKNCPDQIGSALVASLIFKSLESEAKLAGKLLLAEELNANARSVSIVCCCFTLKRTRCHIQQEASRTHNFVAFDAVERKRTIFCTLFKAYKTQFVYIASLARGLFQSPHLKLGNGCQPN